MYQPGLDLCRDRGEAFTEDADLVPRQLGLLAAETRRLRIVIVSEVRFLREGLAEFLQRDPSISVVGLCADLAEVVALSPLPQATWCWSTRRCGTVSPRPGGPAKSNRTCASSLTR